MEINVIYFEDSFCLWTPLNFFLGNFFTLFRYKIMTIFPIKITCEILNMLVACRLFV